MGAAVFHQRLVRRYILRESGHTLRAAENWRSIPSISYTLSISDMYVEKIALFAIFRIAKAHGRFPSLHCQSPK